MSTALLRLLPLFERELSHAEPMVLATLVSSAGPTYTKPGAQLLIARGGEYAGLLSGGCLEGDLNERAARVFETGLSQLVRYDMRGADDLLFGLGSGCEGAMDILLQRLDSGNDWQPLRRQTDALRARRAQRLLLVVRGPSQASSSTSMHCAAGSGLFLDGEESFGNLDERSLETLRELGRSAPQGHGSHMLESNAWGADVLLLDQPAPPGVLLLGAGPDALPVAQLAVFLGWSLTVIDHRSHYARPDKFPGAEAVLDGGPVALRSLLAASPAERFGAAIVMSHHLRTDLGYLRALADSPLPYVGLLGPPSRRDRLLSELEEAEAAKLALRLRAPIGLDLGARSPEAIALSIVAEIHAALAGGVSMTSLSTLRPHLPRAVTTA